MTPDMDWTSIPQALLEDCAQLTKANSIDGKAEHLLLMNRDCTLLTTMN